MDKILRIVTGGIITILSILLIIFLGFLNEQGIDYISLAFGAFFFCIGIVILFNKKEDEIEKIKKRK